LDVMHQQIRYWKITDYCIEFLIRFAKLEPLVSVYLHKHPQDIEPFITFLTNYPDPPMTRSYQHLPNSNSSSTQVQLFKLQHDHHFAATRLPTAYESYGLPTRSKIIALETLIRQGDLDDDCPSDSDEDFRDRVLHVGDWMDCKDTANNWLCACVVAVGGNRVLVRYSRWSEKWDEWLDSSSPRLRKLGTKTSKLQVEQRFIKGLEKNKQNFSNNSNNSPPVASNNQTTAANQPSTADKPNTPTNLLPSTQR